MPLNLRFYRNASVIYTYIIYDLSHCWSIAGIYTADMRFVIVLITLFASLWCSAAPQLGLDNEKLKHGRLDLAPYVDVLEDPSKNLSLAQIISQPHQWHSNQQSVINFAFTDSAYWLRVNLSAEQLPQQLLVEISHAGVDYIDYYLVAGNTLIHQVNTGERQPFSSRDIPYRNYLFNLPINHEASQIYIRLDSYDGLIENAPLTLWTQQGFSLANGKRQLGLGLFFGIMVVMAIYNLFLFLAVKHRAYLFYVCYIVSLLLYTGNYYGFTGTYLWPEDPDWNNQFRLIATDLGILSTIYFTRNFLNLGNRKSLFYWLFNLLTVITCINLFMSFSGYYASIAKLNLILVIITVLSCYVAGVYRLIKGYRPARYFLLAWSIFLLSLVVFTIKHFGWITASLMVEISIQIGSCIEVVLLSLGLADRINILKQQRQLAQQQALAAQESELVASENASKLKDEFLANTSHELRTPLNGIIGLASSLIEGARGELNSGVKKDLSMVVYSGKRLANLVNDILDFSKLKDHNLRLNPKAVELKAITDVVVTLTQPLIKANTKIALVNQITTQLPPAHADENRLAQILHNLIGNAVKFTDSGQVTIQASVKDAQLQIDVKDTGIGIAKEQQQLIFCSFEQLEDHTRRTRSGTGLGLAISKQLIELHGGNLWVNSTPGQGSTFSFTLPISDEEVQTEQLNQALADPIDWYDQEDQPVNIQIDGDHFHILVVDDDPINRQVLINYLSLQHYRITEAHDGEQALQAIENDGPFDLVLLDIMMPRLSGYDVCAKLRRSHSLNDLPVIFLTAKNQVADMKQSFNVGGNDYLTKPINKHELLTRVETHLKFLDIHRSLESKVSERTEDLELKNQQLIATSQQLVEAEKMASLGTLSAGVAHEINNPTNFVHVSSENMEIDLRQFEQFLFELAGEDSDEQIIEAFMAKFEELYHHLYTIKEGTQRIKTIVQDLRAFTQLDAADHKYVMVDKLLQSTINLIQTQFKELTEFVCHFEDIKPIKCYPAQLNQVFMNLLINSCDAISTRQETRPGKGVIEIYCSCAQDAINIIIKDNGCGMDEATSTRIFEPFYTTKDTGKGTGLGLSISWGIIQKHQGQLRVESELNQGTSFYLSLPLAP